MEVELKEVMASKENLEQQQQQHHFEVCEGCINTYLFNFGQVKQKDEQVKMLEGQLEQQEEKIKTLEDTLRQQINTLKVCKLGITVCVIILGRYLL